MQNTVRIHDKEFVKYIDHKDILSRVRDLSKQMSADLQGENPVFIGVLNGSFRFASDLFAEVDMPCEINFIKLSSYKGMQSTGQVNEVDALNTDISNRTVVIVEDIVDTGRTLDFLITNMKKRKPKSIKIASLLHKPDAYLCDYKIDYLGFEIPDLFVVGYGLDFDGQGRNLNDIYQIKH